MFKKIVQIIFFILLISAVAIIQFSGIYALPPFFRDLNLLLIILVFTIFFYDFRSSLAVSLVGGFTLDVLTFNFFGFYLFSLFLTVLFSTWVLKRWLTNRSLYSFILLILLATLFNNVVVGLFSYFSINTSFSFFLGSSYFWSTFLYQSIWSVIFALLMFSGANSFTRRWQPFFLKKS